MGKEKAPTVVTCVWTPQAFRDASDHTRMPPTDKEGWLRQKAHVFPLGRSAGLSLRDGVGLVASPALTLTRVAFDAAA